MPRLTCISCRLELPVTEFYVRKEKRSVRGYSSECKPCRRSKQRSRKRVRLNRDHDYRIKRPGLVKRNRIGVGAGERRCTRCHQSQPIGEFGPKAGTPYRASWCRSCVRDHARDRARVRREQQPEKVQAAKKRHSQSERGRKWKRKRSVIDNNARRQRRCGAAYFWTWDHWQFALQWWGGRCAYCGGSADEQDHFVPLSAPDCPGTVPGNMVPACGRCNRSKGAKLADAWGLDAERHDRILSYLQVARLRFPISSCESIS